MPDPREQLRQQVASRLAVTLAARHPYEPEEILPVVMRHGGQLTTIQRILIYAAKTGRDPDTVSRVIPLPGSIRTVDEAFEWLERTANQAGELAHPPDAEHDLERIGDACRELLRCT